MGAPDCRIEKTVGTRSDGHCPVWAPMDQAQKRPEEPDVTRRSLLNMLLVTIVFCAGALWAHYASLPAAQAQQGTTVRTVGAGGAGNPAVGCVPQAYVTEHEEDPFDSTKIRRTRTTVTSVAIVYADGTVHTKQVEN